MTLTKVLITGPMRSGTTFLANFINANQNCMLYRDTLTALFRISPLLRINDVNTILDERKKNILLTRIKAELANLGMSTFKNLTSNDFKNLKDLLNLFFEKLAQKNTKLVGIKVTEASDWCESLLEHTDIKIIHLVRDFRDILLSSKNTFVEFNKHVTSRKLKKSLNRILSIENSRFCYVRFEDLLINPEQTISTLSDFLGVKLDYKVDSLKDRGNEDLDWEGNSSFHDIKKTFDTKAAYRWRSKKDDPLVKYASVVLKKILKKFSYEEIKVKVLLKIYYKITYLLPFPRKRQKFLSKIFKKKQFAA
ncbi:MAG: sulfotransferase [Asgard group archaeon]|nr:sulfotransferase [Asgard group archaeon]